ncbi:anti-repressor SinI family protein [Peribacillus sp. SCS-37]|uniref:anti-repressor SinI family protein n=1 Tax=Paraperibacillus esterisolvens TaxID=3115296 RepID=UPI003905A736
MNMVTVKDLDAEWIALFCEARRLGLSLAEIKQFLQENRPSKAPAKDPPHHGSAPHQ